MDDLTALLTQGFEVFKSFRDVGLLAGLALLINLLVNVTKLSPVEKLLSGIKPLRGVVAVALGLAAGLVTGLVQGQGWGQVVLMAVGGAVGGSGAVALNELVGTAKELWVTLRARLGV